MLSHPIVTLPEPREWHYKCASTVFYTMLLRIPPGAERTPKASSIAWLRCFGTGRFAHMQRAPVGTAEGGGDALLAFQAPAKRGPARSLGALAQAAPDHLHELIRDHCDEQMPFGANR